MALQGLPKRNLSQGSHPRKSIRQEPGKLIGRETHCQILQRHLAQNQNSGRKGTSLGIIQKCATHERSPCAPKFEERSNEETLHQEICATRIGEIFYELKNADKATFYTPIEARVMPAPTSKSPEEREFVVDSGPSVHMMSKKE